MENKKNYFKDLFLNGHLIIALLLTSLTITLIVANYDYNFLPIIFYNRHILTLTTIVIACFSLVLFIYLCINIKSKDITTADSLYLAFILTGVGYLIYAGLVLKTFNLNRLIFPIALIIVGYVFTTIRSHAYYTAKDRKPFNALNKISKYYAGIFSKYSLLGIIITSSICLLFSYFLTDNPTLVELKKHPKTIIICAICVLPSVIYALSKITSKHITVFDALGFACIWAMPLILIKLFLLTYTPLKISVWALAFAIYIIYLLFRFKHFDDQAQPKEQENHSYFIDLFKKYDFLLILSVGGLIAMFSSLLIDCDLLHPVYVGGTIDIQAHLLPTLILTLFVLLALLFFALVILFGCRKKEVCVVDLFLFFSLSFIVFSFIALISHPSPIMTILLSAFLVYTLVMLIVRVAVYKKQ